MRKDLLPVLGISLLFAAHGVIAYNETLCRQERELWMDEYREFHKANRGAPDARYLVYYCGPGQNLCAGTGDRVRGILYLLRVAAVHRMVFLAVWARPLQLTHFFSTNEINWTTDGLPDDIVSKIGKEHNELEDGEFFGVAEYGSNLDRWRQVRVHTTTAWPASIVDHRVWNTTLWPAAGFLTLLGPLGGVHREQEERWMREFTWYIDISACWFHFAFRTADAIEQRGRDLLRAAYPAASGPGSSFIAWHWRTGGQHGETGIIRQENSEFFRSRLQQLMASINCARKIAAEHDVLAPVLVVTDLNPFRTWIQSGAMGSVATTLPSIAQHIDMSDGQLETYQDVIADAWVVSQGKCVLISQSGFSNTALMMRKEPLCFMHMDVCLKQQEGFFRGVGVRRASLLGSGGSLGDEGLEPLAAGVRRSRRLLA